jgi:hypothetical protein
MIDKTAIRIRFEALRGQLDERSLRLFAAAEVRAAGYGGLAVVSRITGLARSTLGRGLKDISAPALAEGRMRRVGSGRRALTETDPTLLSALKDLVEPSTLGDPERPLMWVSKSLEKLSKALGAQGHTASPNTVRKLLGVLGYCRQANRKSLEGRQHVDRDAQFQHINAMTQAFLSSNDPVISVDTKKKELIGPYKNGGTDFRPKGSPQLVDVHDFPDKELGKVVPYGIYDIAENKGWFSVGVNHDTSEFAVNAIRRWRELIGVPRYSEAKRLLITADCGGSNGVRVRLWKRELQKLADETNTVIYVCHYPPGTSKWNKVEHRLFCHVTQNWRAEPLTSRMTVIDLISKTTTKAGLTVSCELDTRLYEKGIKVTDAEMDCLNIGGDTFHPEWICIITPRDT